MFFFFFEVSGKKLGPRERGFDRFIGGLLSGQDFWTREADVCPGDWHVYNETHTLHFPHAPDRKLYSNILQNEDCFFCLRFFLSFPLVLIFFHFILFPSSVFISFALTFYYLFLSFFLSFFLCFSHKHTLNISSRQKILPKFLFSTNY